MASIPARLLECTICLQRLNDPRILPCDHLFCIGCITDWLNKVQECPYCREKATLDQLKQPSRALREILSNANDNPKCDECNNRPDALKKCHHCSKDLCTACENRHLEEVKEEVRKLCELVGVHLQEFERQEENVATMISAATWGNASLIQQLRSAYDSLSLKISSLHSRSLEKLKNAQNVSTLALNDQIEEVELLIGRIRTCISESIQILGKRDLSALINLDDEIDRLKGDINNFQQNQRVSNTTQVNSPLNNFRINPSYKFIATVIKEAETWRKSTCD